MSCDTDSIGAGEAWAAFRDQPPPLAPSEVLTLEALHRTPEPVTPVRGGRWTRLIRAGAVIRAHPDPIEMVLFGQPQPLGIKLERPPSSAANPRRTQYVPYDPNDQAGPRPRSPLALREWLRKRHHIPVEEANLLDTVADTDEPDQPNLG